MIEWKLRRGDFTLSERVKQAQYFIRMVLLVDWDPIAIFGEPAAEDEYDTYVPQIFQLLRKGEKSDEIAEYLHWIEIEMMGMPPQPSSPRNAAAEKLKSLWTDYFSQDFRPEL